MPITIAAKLTIVSVVDHDSESASVRPAQQKTNSVDQMGNRCDVVLFGIAVGLHHLVEAIVGLLQFPAKRIISHVQHLQSVQPIQHLLHLNQLVILRIFYEVHV